jgi:large subunit ribosomal protein L15
VNLDQLSGAFKANESVDPESLQKAHLLRDPRNPVKVLGRGDLKIALKLKVHRISAQAKSKIEAAGGSVEMIEAEPAA